MRHVGCRERERYRVRERCRVREPKTVGVKTLKSEASGEFRVQGE